MNLRDNITLSKEQVGVLDEYIDLLSSGYINMFAVYQADYWLIKLKHSRNGRILTLYWSPSKSYLSENKRILKTIA